jgi:hypothetical protein
MAQNICVNNPNAPIGQQVRLLLQEVTEKMMINDQTIHYKLYLIGILYNQPGFAEEFKAAAAETTNRLSRNSQQAAEWWTGMNYFQLGYVVGRYIINSHNSQSRGGAGSVGIRRQRGGQWRRAVGMRRNAAWMVTYLCVPAMFLGGGYLFSALLGGSATFVALQSYVHGFLVSSNILYGTCDSSISVAARQAVSVLSFGNVWSCSQFAVADDRTLNSILGWITASGFSLGLPTSQMFTTQLETLCDMIDYILFYARPKIGLGVLQSAQTSTDAAAAAAAVIDQQAHTSCGRSVKEVSRALAPASAELDNAIQQGQVSEQADDKVVQGLIGILNPQFNSDGRGGRNRRKPGKNMKSTGKRHTKYKSTRALPKRKTSNGKKRLTMRR